MPAPDRSTPASPWCCEPVGKYGAGACGTVDCCLEREPQSRMWRPLRSGASCRLERRHLMDVIVERCAGLDVHRDSVVATVRVPAAGKSRRRREQQTRSFGTTIGQLETLADWLEGLGVTLVGMEATGVYWKPVFYVLERRLLDLLGLRAGDAGGAARRGQRPGRPRRAGEKAAAGEDPATASGAREPLRARPPRRARRRPARPHRLARPDARHPRRPD